MSVDEELYMNIEDLKINYIKPHGPQETDSCPERAEAVAGSETTHFKVVIVCLGVLCFTLLITAVGVGARYSTVYNQLMRYLMNRTLETERLQIQNYNLTEERDHINRTYHSVLAELGQAKANIVSCPEGWRRFRCSCYLLSTSSSTWDDSRGQCQMMGADLIIINSPDEMVWLNKFGVKFWIGLSRQPTYSMTTPSWKWTDGSSLTTSYWQHGHPQNYNNRYTTYNRNCASFNIHTGSFYQTWSWSSDVCRSYQQWVCEKQATVPETS